MNSTVYRARPDLLATGITVLILGLGLAVVCTDGARVAGGIHHTSHQRWSETLPNNVDVSIQAKARPQDLREIQRVRQALSQTQPPACHPRHRHKCRQERKALKKKLKHVLRTMSSTSETNSTVETVLSRRKRTVTSDTAKRWPDGVIPYTIKKGDYTGSQVQVIKSAMQSWEEQTCVVFLQREPTHLHYLLIEKTNLGCSAEVGMQGTGQQMMSLGRRCLVSSVVKHELGHALGYFHEHNRPDRDDYVKILTENIMTGGKYEFEKKKVKDVDYLDEPYDYRSIMHYPKYHFTKKPGAPTMQVKPLPGMVILPRLGGRTLSQGDIRRTNRLYNCPSCGRTMQKLTDSFGHTAQAHREDGCQWRISISPGSIVVLEVTELNIPRRSNCKTSYLEVRDGPTAKHPLIGRYCAANVPEGTIKATGNRMWLEFKSNRKGQSFRASYSGSCEGYVTREQGEISSPNFPSRYLPFTNCTWVLTAGLAGRVYLTFDIFSVEFKRRCVDYVELRDGPNETSPLIGRYCSRRPQPVQSSGRSLFIRFVSNKFLEKTGFLLSYLLDVNECEISSPCHHLCENTIGGFKCSCPIEMELHSDGRKCIPKCGGTIKSGQGSMTSPSYPDLYPADKSCTWYIQPPPRHVIYLDFTHFDLEGDIFQECQADSLTIKSGERGGDQNTLGRFCGFLHPRPLTLQESEVTVTFTSDKSVEKSGFELLYHIDVDECATHNGGCHQICQNSMGSFSCSCLPGYSLQEDGTSCFTTDLCEFHIKKPRGIFYSLNFPFRYPNRHDCSWSVQTLVGHRVRISFRTFIVEEERRCRYDHLNVYDGANETAAKLATLCGYQPPDPVTSSSNVMFLHFFSDASQQYTGFYIRHDTVCSGDVQVTTTSQILVSHGDYGNTDYANRQRCHWSLRADPGYVIEVIFDTFDVEYEEGCMFDSVEIYDGQDDSAPQLGRFCGDMEDYNRYAPSTQVSSGTSMYISFSTDDTITTTGFSLAFHQVLPENV